jgi:ABC-type sugar transport system substrate-binding protein
VRKVSIIKAVTIAIVAVGLAACGNTGATEATDSPVAGSGSLDGKGKSLVAFMFSSADAYYGAEIPALKAEAKRLNYDLKVFENNFDQGEMDQQVQQWLATGEEPEAILYLPATADASVNSARLLSQRAPVIAFGGEVPEAAATYVQAYAGTSHVDVGRSAGTLVLQSIKEQTDAGKTFSGKDGKPSILEIKFPSGNLAGTNRATGFNEVAGDAVSVLATEHVTGFDAAAGFKAASQVIPKFKASGIDYIYVENNALAVGVVSALEQNGVVPGKDVIVVAGDLSGDRTALEQGKIYGAVMMSPIIEAILTLETTAKYLATGEVIPGEERIALEAVKPETTMASPRQETYMPHPPLQAEDLPKLHMWGYTTDELMF